MVLSIPVADAVAEINRSNICGAKAYYLDNLDLSVYRFEIPIGL